MIIKKIFPISFVFLLMSSPSFYCKASNRDPLEIIGELSPLKNSGDSSPSLGFVRSSLNTLSDESLDLEEASQESKKNDHKTREALLKPLNEALQNSQSRGELDDIQKTLNNLTEIEKGLGQLSTHHRHTVVPLKSEIPWEEMEALEKLSHAAYKARKLFLSPFEKYDGIDTEDLARKGILPTTMTIKLINFAKNEPDQINITRILNALKILSEAEQDFKDVCTSSHYLPCKTEETILSMESLSKKKDKASIWSSFYQKILPLYRSIKYGENQHKFLTLNKEESLTVGSFDPLPGTVHKLTGEKILFANIVRQGERYESYSHSKEYQNIRQKFEKYKEFFDFKTYCSGPSYAPYTLPKAFEALQQIIDPHGYFQSAHRPTPQYENNVQALTKTLGILEKEFEKTKNPQTRSILEHNMITTKAYISHNKEMDRLTKHTYLMTQRSSTLLHELKAYLDQMWAQFPIAYKENEELRIKEFDEKFKKYLNHIQKKGLKNSFSVVIR